MTEKTAHHQRPDPSRRHVTSAVAWTLPAIVAASATPLAAASGGTGTGIITFNPATYTTISGTGYGVITGQVFTTGGSAPTTINLTYASGYSGPATATVSGTGTFSVSGVTGPVGVSAGVGAITASQTGFTSASANLAVTPSGTGIITFNPTSYATVSGTGFSVITGQVFTTGGSAPTSVNLTFAAGYSGPATATVSGTGAFSVIGVTGPIGASQGVGAITASRAGFTSANATLTVTP